MRVLVCDDSKTMSSIISEYVREDGHDVTCVNDGNKALEEIQATLPDLIIMDVEMPGMNGFEVTQKIRETWEDWIPIIFVTGKSDDESLNKGIESGGDDYLLKPISAIILKSKIRAMARLVDMRNQLVVLNSKLEKLSITDSLTGILNRRGFESEAEKLRLSAIRNSSYISVIMIDVDHFKQYNDNYGHPKGDECLKEVAKSLEQALVRPLDRIARVGGEEFAVVLVEADISGAEVVTQRLLSAVRDLKIEHSWSTAADVVTISAGVAVARSPSDTCIYELMDLADKALYSSKERGRNQYGLRVAEQRKRIFAVDDDVSTLSIYRSILGDYWDIYTFNKVNESIERAREIVPDLMLVDIVMPGKDGYELVSQIRNNEITKEIPIIFVSSMTEESQRSKAKVFGVDDYVNKPLDFDRLFERIQSFIGVDSKKGLLKDYQ